MKTVKHISPSWFVQQTRIYKQWCNITICRKCGTRAKYEDRHQVNPCPECGSSLICDTGRWVEVREVKQQFKWFPLFKITKVTGYWQKLSEENHA